VLSWLLACSSSPAPFDPGPVAPRALVIEPASAILETGPDGAAPLQFQALADYGGDALTPLDVVSWTLSNRSAGQLDDAGLFTASTTNGGEALLTATFDGQVATASLLVMYKEARVDEGVDPTWFDGPSTEATGRWLYPPDEVVLPRNTPSVHLQWTAVEGAAYKLSLRSRTSALDVYTARNELIADGPTWSGIASTNAGGTITVDLTAYINGERFAEPTRNLHVDRLDASGSIIYWASTKGGLVEIPYGLPASDFLTQAQTGRCVACHAVSRDGKVAWTYDGGDGVVGSQHAVDRSTIVAPEQGQHGNFHTFSPDGRFRVSVYHGNLSLYDADTGAWLRDVWTAGDATHPDWSPADDRLVFVRTVTRGSDWSIGHDSALLTLDHDGNGQFSNPQVRLTAAPGTVVYYPSFSPDGAWIAYNRSTGDAYDDLDAEVWVLPSDGGAPLRLDAANAEGQLSNSWPRWGPIPDSDVLWLAFASRRPYGFVQNNVPQIWVTAFDARRARQGVDPSSPAHWLAGQESATSNHIPVWTEW
jgi:hypothetical protein